MTNYGTGRCAILITGLVAMFLASACQDEVGLGNIQPVVVLSQDWDADSVFESLPNDPDGAGDYLLDFGQVVVRQRATRYITLANDSSAKMELTWQATGIRLQEGSSEEFFLDKPPVNVLQPGHETVFAIHYIPSEDGQDTGAVIVETSDPDNKSLVIQLTGEGVSTDVEVCLIDPDSGAERCNQGEGGQDVPLALDFGMNDLGESSSHRFVVRNVGEFNLTVAAGGGQAGVDFGAGSSNEYMLDPDPWSGSLTPGESREFGLVYTPIDGGADASSVEVTSDDPDEPVVVIDLQGNGLAPKICPQPPFLVDFGSIGIATTLNKDYQFTSCGNQVLRISELSIDSGVHGYFTFYTEVTTPFDLSPGETFDAELLYSPQAEGAHAGKLYIRSNDPNAGEGWIDLVGKATPVPTCDIYVVPTSLDFGTVSTSGFKNQTVSIQNAGDADCNVTEIRGPQGSPEFSLPTVPVLPVLIAPGDIKQFSVQYRPVDEGSDQATVTVVCENDPDEAETVVSLAAEGIEPPPCDFQADPGLLNFGSVPMGERRTLQTRIWNFGSEDCTIWNLGLTPGSDPSFGHGPNPFPPPAVDPGTYVEIEVYVDPQQAGLLSGELEVRAGENPVFTQKVYVSLTAAGEAARMCLNPTVLDFGPVNVGDYLDMSFDITACGSGNLRIRQVAFDGSNPDFTFVMPPGTPYTVQAGQTRSLQVRYSPSEPGSDFGRVLVSSNDDQIGTGLVELKGNYTGTCPSVFDCQPAQLVFPVTEIGVGFGSDLAFTCTNHGSEPLTVVSVAPGAGTSPEYRISAPPLYPPPSSPLMVPPGGELHVEVGYVPTDVGLDLGSVVISSEFSHEGCDNFTLITVPMEAEGKQADLPECIQPHQFQPTLEFGWPAGAISSPNSKHLFMTPIVINLTDDNSDGFINEEDVPDIVFSSHVINICLDPQNPECIAWPAMLRAISGDDGHEIWSVDDPRFKVNWETQIAAGDIDGDNLPEILASKHVYNEAGSMFSGDLFITGNILCFEHDGSFKWESEPWHAPEGDMEDSSAIGIADLDHDGHPEIFRGSSVFDRHGQLLWEGAAGRGTLTHGCFSTAADLDNQGDMELVAGNTAYRSDGTIMWSADKPDGLVGIADFNLDGTPEVLLASSAWSDRVVLLDGLTGAVVSTLADSDVNAILTPVIADIDGQGGPEIGLIGTCTNPGVEDGGECFWGIDVNETSLHMSVIWQEYVDDITLGGGNSAFDFEGDGPFEVLQNDEHWVNIYAGLAHTTIYHAERFSVTGWETPLVVDVDNDDHAEIIVIQNGPGMSEGLLVYGNVDNDWVATRRIWNQFDFHITNVRENGTIPRFEVPNWTVYNNFLANEPFCQ